MKKELKNRFFLIFMTAFVCIGGTVTATTLYNSSQVLYTPNDDTWDVDNVNDALNGLFDNLNNGLLGKTYQVYKHENATPTILTMTVPSDCKKGYLVVQRYGYNNADVTITITDSSGMKTHTELLSNYGKDVSQTSPVSVWYAEFIPNSTITISATCPSYSLGTTIGMILY